VDLGSLEKWESGRVVIWGSERRSVGIVYSLNADTIVRRAAILNFWDLEDEEPVTELRLSTAPKEAVMRQKLN
jgi:hypothetical protein